MMTSYKGQYVFFVDDEPRICKAVFKTLKGLDLKVSCFTNAADCLKQSDLQKCNLLITDVRMPGMDGLELLNRIRQTCPWMPVLVITGYGDIPMAVKALKAGAADFIEKPLSRKNFIKIIKSILRKNIPPSQSQDKRLTRSEIKVLRLILDGKNGPEIARLLNRSARTIEYHRNNVMHKLGAHNLADLVRKSIALGLL